MRRSAERRGAADAAPQKYAHDAMQCRSTPAHSHRAMFNRLVILSTSSCPIQSSRVVPLRARSYRFVARRSLECLVTLTARRGVSLHLVSCANVMRGRGPFPLGARVRGAPCPPAREVTADTPGSWPGECHPVSGAQLVSKLMSTTTVTAYVSATNWRSMRYEARKIKGCKQKKNRPSSLRDGCW